MTQRIARLAVAGLLIAAIGFADSPPAHMGKQPDNSFIVSSGRRIEPATIAFAGRPKDLALHPSGAFFAVLNQKTVFLANAGGVIAQSTLPLESEAAHRGAIWSPDGKNLLVSIANGSIQEFDWNGSRLTVGPKLLVAPEGDTDNPRPGGMCITRDGSRLFVAACDRNSVVELDLRSRRRIHEYRAQNLPFEVQLSQDETTLVVSNWGGRQIKADDESYGATGNTMIVTDPRGAAASGTVCLIKTATGATTNLDVGLHPTAIAVRGDHAYVANAASDNISEISISGARVVRTIALKWGTLNLFGSMPCALAATNRTLYVCNGGDNAVCELDLQSGRVLGFRPAGYFPTAIAIANDGKQAFVLNTKGNGSTEKTSVGQPGNVHDFQGTVSVLDLTADLKESTDRVARDNNWNRDRSELNPKLEVYNGAIHHVLYIIKENRTYDQILGDVPQGNGDPNLCLFGEQITPNAHALVSQFTLFDNSYVSGTNSADGHSWSTQSIANDYLEHFYDGYRTYPDDGDCAMSISSAGCLWDAALKKGLSLRVYGEFADDELAVFTPTVTSWLQVWKDRVAGTHRIQKQIGTRLPSLRPYMQPHYVYWPLLQSDQERADLFIGEYSRLSRVDKVPNLMIMSLPCDHTEGRNPDYPKPQSMVADNDMALGRIVDAVSHSPQWKNTCIFVIEDDAQSGLDHVDGHRTVYMALSPYVRRKYVDSKLYTTVSMIRSAEKMLRIDPMNRFDALTPPITDCFSDTPDLTPYNSVLSHIPLDDMNLPVTALNGLDRTWTRRSMALDWSGADRPDPRILDEVIWHSVRGVNTPYPLN